MLLKMQVIYKIDKVFLIVNSLLILFFTIVFYVIFENFWIFLIGFFVELIYLFFSLQKSFKRLKALKSEFPQRWRKLLSERLLFYKAISGDRKKRFENDVKIFLSSFSIEGTKGRAIDEDKKVIIAGAVASMLNGRPEWEPPFKDSIVVYPSNTIDREFNMNKGNITGMASKRGPLIVTEGGLNYSFSNNRDGYNVIYHEIAHFFDFEDGEAAGVPLSRILPTKANRWRKIIHKEWKRVREKPYIRDYAATNEAEFFAVATEYFFEAPSVLKKHSSELYELLKEFYNLDTYAILESK